MGAPSSLYTPVELDALLPEQRKVVDALRHLRCETQGSARHHTAFPWGCVAVTHEESGTLGEGREYRLRRTWTPDPTIFHLVHQETQTGGATAVAGSQTVCMQETQETQTGGCNTRCREPDCLHAGDPDGG